MCLITAIQYYSLVDTKKCAENAGKSSFFPDILCFLGLKVDLIEYANVQCAGCYDDMRQKQYVRGFFVSIRVLSQQCRLQPDCDSCCVVKFRYFLSSES